MDNLGIGPNPLFDASAPRTNMWRQPLGVPQHSVLTMRVSLPEVLAYARRYDANRLHHDAAHARAQGVARGVSLPGTMIAAVAVRLVQSPEHSEGAVSHRHVLLAGRTDERLRRPCFPGEVFRTESVKVAQRLASKGGRGIMTFRVGMFDEAGEEVYTVTNTMIASLDPADLEHTPAENAPAAKPQAQQAQASRL